MIEAELKKRANLIDEAIHSFLPLTPPDELYKATRHLLDAGGKRLRPTTLLLATEATGGIPENVIPAAIAIEFIHNFTLIHDDIIDQADMRRGLPSVHKKWGVGYAIIAGDTLYSKAFEIISTTRCDPALVSRGIELLSKSCIDISEGQWMDMNFQKRADVKEEEYFTMIEKKTAVLIAAAAKIGAIRGGANDEETRALWDYGRLIGTGFQIYDDVLDLITPEEILGKARGGDIVEGKRTLIVINAFQKGAELPALGKESATRYEVEKTISTLKDIGSIDYAMNKALSFVAEGKSKLAKLKESKAREILMGLADYMIERKY